MAMYRPFIVLWLREIKFPRGEPPCETDRIVNETYETVDLAKLYRQAGQWDDPTFGAPRSD